MSAGVSMRVFRMLSCATSSRFWVKLSLARSGLACTPKKLGERPSSVAAVGMYASLMMGESVSIYCFTAPNAASFALGSRRSYCSTIFSSTKGMSGFASRNNLATVSLCPLDIRSAGSCPSGKSTTPPSKPATESICAALSAAATPALSPSYAKITLGSPLRNIGKCSVVSAVPIPATASVKPA